MANLEYKVGDYQITANSPPTKFTFWWGRDSRAPHEYFDVSISPKFNNEHRDGGPLVELKREVYHDPRPGVGVVLVLTLQNNNPFSIDFTANHVRVYP